METNINRAAEPTCDGAPLHPSLSHFSQTSAWPPVSVHSRSACVFVLAHDLRTKAVAAT